MSPCEQALSGSGKEKLPFYREKPPINQAATARWKHRKAQREKKRHTMGLHCFSLKYLINLKNI